MTKPTTISFAEIKPPKSGVLVLLAEDGLKFGPAGDKIDVESGGSIRRAAKISGFKGAKKSHLDLLLPNGLGLDRLLVIGVGAIDDYQESDWIALGGRIRSHLTGREGDAAHLVVECAEKKTAISAEQCADIALGVLLRGYRFDKYKSEKGKAKKDKNDDKKKVLKRLVVQTDGAAAARRAFRNSTALAEGITFARDLVNEPANILNPREFAQRIKGLDVAGLDVKILDDKALKSAKMNALLSVGHGSAEPCRLVVMRWQGVKSKAAKPVVFVGKGVTFDTGGISLKPSQGMGDMKGDMAGAACVAGLMQALALRKANVNAVGVVGLVENMPSGNATRPGDVVTSRSGTTIEILNTDAEGRLVLADALSYAQDELKPRCIVNLATLTGAIIVALGKEHAGLFSNNDNLAGQLAEAGQATGDKVWRLPLGPKYDELIDSKVADIKNIGGRWAGSITAAQFLQRFVADDMPWAHLDIAGTAMDAPKSDINQSWGSGFGVRLLDRLVADHYED